MSRAYQISQLNITQVQVSINELCGLRQPSLPVLPIQSQAWYESLLIAMIGLEELENSELDEDCTGQRTENRRRAIWKQFLLSFGAEITAYSAHNLPSSPGKLIGRENSDTNERIEANAMRKNESMRIFSSEANSDSENDSTSSLEPTLEYKQGTWQRAYVYGILPENGNIHGVICVWPPVDPLPIRTNIGQSQLQQQHQYNSSSDAVQEVDLFVMAALSAFEENNSTQIYQAEQTIFGLVFHGTKFPQFYRMDINQRLLDVVNGIGGARGALSTSLSVYNATPGDSLTTKKGRQLFNEYIDMWKRAIATYD